MTQPLAAMPSHIDLRRVEWGETDAAGIVFYPNYFRWFDRGAHELFRSLGIELAVLAQDPGVGPVIVEATCRLTAPLRHDDSLTVRAQVAEVRTRALRIEYTVLRGDVAVAHGHEVRVWASLRSDPLEPLPIPTEFRRLLSEAR